MGVLAKEINWGVREYPKGVYGSKSGRFEARYWLKGGERIHIGTYDSPEEAAYRRHIEMYGHHWYNMPDDIHKYFGFLYIMTHRATGKKYFGSKQFVYWDGPVGGFKCTDRTNEWYDPKAWKEGQWETYTSSSKIVNKMIADGNVWDWNFEWVELCKDKLTLKMREMETQRHLNVLDATLPNGEYEWLNENIGGVAFRPPFRLDGLKETIEESKEALRNYYLKPKVCEDCGSVIPFGHRECSNAPIFGDGGCTRS